MVIFFTDSSAFQPNSEEEELRVNFTNNVIDWMENKGHPLIGLNRVNHPKVAALEHHKSQAVVLHQLLTAVQVGASDNLSSIFCLSAH